MTRLQLNNEQESNEIEVTWEDQKSINAFSRLNSSYSDIEEDLRIQREEREALDDLAMELELADEDEAVLYKIADTFVSLPHAEAMERLESEKDQADEQVRGLEAKLDEYEAEMKGLKVKLYAKFGDNISKSPTSPARKDKERLTKMLGDQIWNETPRHQSRPHQNCTCILAKPSIRLHLSKTSAQG